MEERHRVNNQCNMRVSARVSSLMSVTCGLLKNITKLTLMITIENIKPGPKPNKPDGTPDRRRRVTPPNRPNHPDLKPHWHKPND